MSLPVSSKTPVRFTPSSAADQDPAPVYLIRPPGLRDKIEWRREVAVMGARWHTDETMLAALRAGVSAVIAEDQHAQCFEVLDRVEAARERGEGVDEETIELATRIEREVRRHYPRYCDMEAERAHWLEVAPFVAAQMFLVGWENGPGKFKGYRGGASESALAAIPEAHVNMIGNRAISLMSPSATERKNSDAPSVSSSSLEVSTAD